MDPAAHVLAIEIGGTKLQAVVGDCRGVIHDCQRAKADTAGGAPAILEQIKRLVVPLVEQQPVAAVGIGFGGPVDERSGCTIKSHQVAGWDDFPLAAWAERQFGAPCAVGNDTDMAALAEATIGAGRGCRRVFYTNIGSGIGGGFVKEGQLYRAPGGNMEFGHTWMYSQLEQRWDTLENLCSGWALASRRSRLAAADGRAPRDASAVLAAWQHGDEAATALMTDFFECYGRALANIIALLNPDALVIGGGVAQFGKPLFEEIGRTLERFAFPPFAARYVVKPAELGETSVPVGALLAACGRCAA
jgi:glucokinase